MKEETEPLQKKGRKHENESQDNIALIRIVVNKYENYYSGLSSTKKLLQDEK